MVRPGQAIYGYVSPVRALTKTDIECKTCHDLKATFLRSRYRRCAYRVWWDVSHRSFQQNQPCLPWGMRMVSYTGCRTGAGSSSGAGLPLCSVPYRWI
jgi:hypothetical protein